ncbi:MAG: glycoside hydrolase domain-containing protein [Kiritimatiellia bacterium]
MKSCAAMILLALTAGAGTFSDWKKPSKGVLLPSGGQAGGEAIGLEGGKNERWTSPPVEIASDRRYAFVFAAKGPASGSMTSGPSCANVDIQAPGAAWVVHTNVFRASSRPTPTYRETLHLGEWEMSGTVAFDGVKVIPVTPRWKRHAGGIELGPGESIDGNVYGFEATLGSVARNDARPLMVNRAGFNSNRWCLGADDEVVYRHAVAGRRLLKAKVSVTCGHYAGGSAVVEVSNDGTGWTALLSVTNSSSLAAELPAGLFPAEAIWVRFRGLKPCSLQIPAYAMDATLDGEPCSLFGSVQYVEDGTGALVAAIQAPGYYDENYGARITCGDDDATFWTASSGWKIPRGRGVPTATSSGMGLRTAANEAEAVQLVLRPNVSCSDVRVKAGDLKDADGHVLAASAIDVLRVGYVRIERPTDATGCRGLWPDPLLPQTGPCPVRAKENQPFWVRVKPPKGTPAGLYRGTVDVRLTTEDGRVGDYAVPFIVEVFGFELPDKMTVETAFGCDYGIACRYQKAKTPADRAAVYDAYRQALSDHHLSPYDPAPGVSWRVTWKGLKENPLTATPVFDWADWDREMQKAIDTYHFTGFRIAVEGLGWGDWEHRSDPVYQGFKGGTPEYEALMAKYLGGIEAHLREKGWLDMAYVYWYDEPSPRDYPFVMNGFKTLKKYAPGLRRMLTEEPCAELLGGPNVWCPLTPNLRSSGEPEARRRGDVFWWYVCCVPKAPYVTEFTDHPGAEMRLWLWQTWGENVQGILIWTTTWWDCAQAYPDRRQPQNPYEDAMSWSTAQSYKPGTRIGWGNGDGRFLYPPVAAAGAQQAETVLDKPVVSYRLELLRDGIEDYEYFALLKRALARAKHLPDGTRAKYEALLKVPESVYRSMTDFSTDPADMEAHRLRLARAIEALR